MNIISDYEELFKYQDFWEKRKEHPLMQRAAECTLERLKNDLKNQYSENLDDKINRWSNVSKVPYFQDVLPISFYVQSKMLYRDGFYEAAINMARTICEMICHEELSKIPHPFGDLTVADKHSPGFNMLKQFLLFPKKIEKKSFKDAIVSRIVDTGTKDWDSNFIKSAYELKADNHYHLKLISSKKEENLNRLMKILKEVGFSDFETFKPDVLNALEYVWVNGSAYVHIKKSAQDAKTDAFSIVNKIGFVLYSLYAAEATVGTTITSAYSRLKDVCTGVTFAMDVFATPEAAHLGYHNLPSQKQMDRMLKIEGQWAGKWGLNNQVQTGSLEFRKEGEYINGYLTVDDTDSEIQMGISFYGDYFFINQIKGDRTSHFFQLSFLDDNTLIGKHKHDFVYVIFQRQIKEQAANEI